MFENIKKYLDSLKSEFDEIPSERKLLLEKIADYISLKKSNEEPIKLVYICTHNSRRSHFGQVWAHTIADYFGIKKLSSHSGGTEATAFHQNSINALKRVGFKVEKMTEDKNPIYHVFHSEDSVPSICFSKVFDHSGNPEKDFAAIMTCSEAEENCPFIKGADFRFAITYDDPKKFDGTDLQENKYDERCRQIARETFYIFSKSL